MKWRPRGELTEDKTTISNIIPREDSERWTWRTSFLTRIFRTGSSYRSEAMMATTLVRTPLTRGWRLFETNADDREEIPVNSVPSVAHLDLLAAGR